MVNWRLLIAKGLKIILNPPALRRCIIDKTARVCSGSELNDVKVGRYSYIGNKCFMSNVEIGAFCSIADKCSVGGAIHPIDRVSSSPVFHEGRNILRKNFSELSAIHTPKTIIENDVWLGMGVYVKAGVRIHTGAVIGMGSIVTKDIPAYEVWAGNPAHKIKDRFDDEIKSSLIKSKWWDWDDSKIASYAHLFNKPELFLNSLNDELEQS